ncbi:MAG: GntR family transcriptional regulator [Gammaproteobacteria bacterium]|nr:GntR family transcriptional regulator [Gammaproteobacteria bacterium]
MSSQLQSNSHHKVRESLRERIESSEWKLGELIPTEVDLAKEYGCARTTINRALQALADEGILIRKRKGGTRVCPIPIRQAKLSIPILREQVEAIGSEYSHQLVGRKIAAPSQSIRQNLKIDDGDSAFYAETIHFADHRPFAYEERWVNLKTVPEIENETDFDLLSINEWLIKTVPFSSGEVSFSAHKATERTAKALQTDIGAALFLVDRTTWMNGKFITTMKLYYREGYRLSTTI